MYIYEYKKFHVQIEREIIHICVRSMCNKTANSLNISTYTHLLVQLIHKLNNYQSPKWCNYICMYVQHANLIHEFSIVE